MSFDPSTSSSSSQSFPPAPALFCEPSCRDFGTRWFGQRGFGGLLEDWRGSADGSTRWIPQYNLQHFWRRQIPPLPVGLIEPLIPPRFRSPDDFSRLPGHFPDRTPEFELYHRNLLEVRHFDGAEPFLKVWTVSERSKRQRLECFRVLLDRKGRPQPESVELISEKKLKLVPPVKPDTESTTQNKKEPLLEIRGSFWNESNLFVRSASLLQVFDESSESLTPIFHTAAKSFAESHLLQGVVAVVDYGGQTWLHDISRGAAQRPEKLVANDAETYQMAIFCDHPKMMAIGSMFHVETVDTRCTGQSRVCGELWRSPAFSTRGYKESLYVQERAPGPAVLRHLLRVPGTPNNYLVMTDRRLHLIDDRFPGKSVFAVQHGFATGTHRMVVSEPICDPEEGGNVYSVFCLEQLPVFNSSVSFAKFYHHPTGIFSSVEPFHSLGEPSQLNQISRRGKHAEPGNHVLAEPTRAIALVENLPGRKEGVAQTLLFRQTDDGAIWWQTLVHEEASEKRKVIYERKSVERIDAERTRNAEGWRREGWRPVYSDGINEEFKETQEQRRVFLSIETADIDRKFIAKTSHRSLNAHRNAAKWHVNADSITEKLEVLPLDDVHSVLSKITMDTWNAAEERIKESENEQNGGAAR